MRQYFYLVCREIDECRFPKKICLQEHEALKYGRRMKTLLEREGDYNSEVTLYKQEITRTGELKYVKSLNSYK